IIVPLIIAMTLLSTGLALAFTGIAPPSRPWMLVPSAAIASVMLFAVARRIGHAAFIWAGLITLTIAYNFSHVFFSDLARQLIDTGAMLVREDRLPYAFYGLTYLPLIIALMISGPILKRRGAAHLADPIGRYATGLSLLLLAVSTTHA